MQVQVLFRNVIVLNGFPHQGYFVAVGHNDTAVGVQTKRFIASFGEDVYWASRNYKSVKINMKNMFQTVYIIMGLQTNNKYDQTSLQYKWIIKRGIAEGFPGCL